jgi:hypothetical protein
MTIVVIRGDFGIVTILSISYDERRRPRWDAPRRINATINFLPAVPRRGPEAGVHRIENNFQGLGENIWIHACFYRALFSPLISNNYMESAEK